MVVAIEMVDIGPRGLEFPRDLGAGNTSREQNLTVPRPGRQVRSAASCPGITVGGGKPHRLAGCHGEMLAAVCAADAKVGPIVARLLRRPTIDELHPLSIRRPARAEVQMSGPSSDPDAMFALQIAGPN